MLRYFLFLTLAATRMLSAQAALPTEWIDPDTGHRVVRLSREDGTQSLYFNQNAYTADGKKLIVTTADGGIATIDLATREVRPLVAGPVSVLVAGHKTGECLLHKAGAGRPGQRGCRTQFQRVHRIRSQCRYGSYARGGQITAGTERRIPQCGRDSSAGHLRGRCDSAHAGGQPVA